MELADVMVACPPLVIAARVWLRVFSSVLRAATLDPKKESSSAALWPRAPLRSIPSALAKDNGDTSAFPAGSPLSRPTAIGHKELGAGVPGASRLIASAKYSGLGADGIAWQAVMASDPGTSPSRAACKRCRRFNSPPLT